MNPHDTEIRLVRHFTMDHETLAEFERLRKIEAQAVKVINLPTWSGDDWYNEMCKLSDVLGEE